jgi:hypothetical protein
VAPEANRVTFEASKCAKDSSWLLAFTVRQFQAVKQLDGIFDFTTPQ